MIFIQENTLDIAKYNIAKRLCKSMNKFNTAKGTACIPIQCNHIQKWILNQVNNYVTMI